MRHPRILNRAAQADEPKGLEEGASPRHRPPRHETRPGALEPQPTKAPFNVLVEVGKMVRRIARAKVLTPTAEHRVEFRNDRTGIVHSVIGRKSFSEDQLKDNLYAFVDAINRSKPTGLKSIYLRSLSISTTMSPGINLGVAQTIADASAAAS